MQIFQTRDPQTYLATKNVCKKRIANVQLEAMGQEQVVQKQKPMGVKKLAKFSLVLDLLVLIPCWWTKQWTGAAPVLCLCVRTKCKEFPRL